MSWNKLKKKAKERKPEPKYVLLLGVPPESLEQYELAALMGLTPQLTKLSAIPGFDPTDVTITLAFGRTGHLGSAKLELADPENPKGEPLVPADQMLKRGPNG